MTLQDLRKRHIKLSVVFLTFSMESVNIVKRFEDCKRYEECNGEWCEKLLNGVKNVENAKWCLIIAANVKNI